MKTLKRLSILVTVCFFTVAPSVLYAQQIRRINIEEVVELAIKNHPKLKISEAGVEMAKQQVTLTKLQQLPTITASASAMYLGEVMLVDKNFSKATHVPSPDFGNSYGAQASELIFNGGMLKKSIEIADLRTQLSELGLVVDQEAIKFLVISNYLDLYKLENQKKVYANNKQLAEERLQNINKFYSQGMVTRNEVIRNELNIKGFDQSILVTKNNRDILNYNINLALGLSSETLIVPTQDVKVPAVPNDIDYYINLANNNNPQLKSAFKNIEIADKNVALANADRMPALSGTAGYAMQRPIANHTPVLDMYANTWVVGVSLNYHIDNLYKTHQKVKLGRLQKSQSEDVLELVKQNVATGINAAYTKYQEAIQNGLITKETMRLAQENYHIIEAKYLNQLAIQAEMTDAINAKLEAELNYSNAEVNILYQYYNLLNATGTL